MQTIKETPQGNRILMVGARGTASDWDRTCRLVREYAAGQDPSDPVIAESLRLVDTPLPVTSQAFVIISAYADIPRGAMWDTVFDPKDESLVESTNAVLLFGVYWDRLAIPSLEHGHHQIAVIDFPNGPPKLLSALPKASDWKEVTWLGLCDSADFPAVTEALQPYRQ